jgi:hypothetical protein
MKLCYLDTFPFKVTSIVSYTPLHRRLPYLEGFPEITVLRVLSETPKFSVPFK